MTYTLSQVTESIGTITLDHERRRNALSHALVECYRRAALVPGGKSKGRDPARKARR